MRHRSDVGEALEKPQLQLQLQFATCAAAVLNVNIVADWIIYHPVRRSRAQSLPIVRLTSTIHCAAAEQFIAYKTPVLYTLPSLVLRDTPPPAILNPSLAD